MARRKTRNQPSTQISPVENHVNAEATDHSVKRVVAHQAFSGPIPHPDIFRKYGEIIPNAPERILKVFEDDSSHVRNIQFAALRAECQDNKRAHWMAWSLIFTGFLLVAFLGWLGKDWLAGIALGTTLTGTIAGFLQNKQSSQKQQDQQSE